MQREISPLDGRYRPQVGRLGTYFSEFALMGARCEIELRYALALEETRIFPPLSPKERTRIKRAIAGFDDAAYDRIKAIESRVRHDVKACEIFLRETLSLDRPNRIHFALTSEDVNNLAYGLLLSRYLASEQRPQLRRLVEALVDRIERWKEIPFPARTHGQPASPTTAGKEMAVFLSRLLRQIRQLDAFRFRGKLNGATGNYASFTVAAPTVDWEEFSAQFVRSLGLEPNPCTTQVEDHDGLAEYFAIVQRIQSIVLDLDLDCWEYISRGDFVQRPAQEEVGSSTMPHKVNPVQFETSEGNLAVSNALLAVLSDRLTRSRMQRDLSGSTMKRAIGAALAHGYLAIEETLSGLERISVDADALTHRVDSAPEVLAEAIQTTLRLEASDDPFEQLREATRGRSISDAALRGLIDRLPIAPETRARLRALRPHEYIGQSVQICNAALDAARAWLQESPEPTIAPDTSKH